MPSRTKFVFLMHPYEHKRVKANTGRLTHLCLRDSELHLGIGFDDHERVQALINDPQNYPVLLYPGRGSRDLSKGELPLGDLGGRRLVVFLLDATWRLVRPMFRTSLSLQWLPRIMFSNAAPSRSASATTLAAPTVWPSACTWRLMLDSAMWSMSTKVKRATPLRASASAAHEPTPPMPTTTT